MRPDLFRPEILGASLRPEADGVAEIKELNAVSLGPRSSGFRCQNIGKLVSFVEQKIPQSIQ